MNMFDEARAMAGTLELCKITQGELAARLGVSQSYVANKLRLLSLPEDIRERIVECGVSERHARALLRARDDEARRRILEKVVTRKLTVRECEALAECEHEAELSRELPELSRMERIDAFVRAVGSGVDTLVSLGVEAKRSIGYYGDKMYITICICEG